VRIIALLVEILAAPVGNDDFSGLGVVFLQCSGRQMSMGILEDKVKVGRFIDIIEEGKRGAEDEHTNSGNKTESQEQQAFSAGSSADCPGG